MRMASPARTIPRCDSVAHSRGSAATIFPHILGKLGCDVIGLNAYMDEARITKTAEEFQRSVRQLCEIVRILKADLGFLLDAGAEKLFLVDEKGVVCSEELTLALAADFVLRDEKGPLVANLSTSRVIDDIAAQHRRSSGYMPIGLLRATSPLRSVATTLSSRCRMSSISESRLYRSSSACRFSRRRCCSSPASGGTLRGQFDRSPSTIRSRSWMGMSSVRSPDSTGRGGR